MCEKGISVLLFVFVLQTMSAEWVFGGRGMVVGVLTWVMF